MMRPLLRPRSMAVALRMPRLAPPPMRRFCTGPSKPAASPKPNAEGPAAAESKLAEIESKLAGIESNLADVETTLSLFICIAMSGFIVNTILYRGVR